MPPLAAIRRLELMQRLKSDTTNPHAAELARLQAELDRKTKLIQESTLLWGDSLGWPDSPMGQRFGPGEWGAGGGLGYGGNIPYPFIDRSINRTHAPLPLLTEVEWRLGVAASQDLCTRNHLAIAFKEFVSNYVGPCQVQFVLRGQTPAPVASGPTDADGDGSPDTDPLIAVCQQLWDEWAELNDWGQGEEDREAECRDRLFRHGDVTLRFFRGGPETDGLPVCRHVEPEMIRSPANATDHQKWGIETPPNDAETVTRIYQCSPSDQTRGEWVDALKFVRVKANVDRTIKRGLPDLFPVASHLRRVVGLLENMGEVAKLQAAIAWIQKYGPLASQEQIRAAITQGADYTGVKLPSFGGQAQTVSVRDHIAGSVIHAENGKVFEPGPMSSPAGFELVEKTIMRSTGLRWCAPQFFSGDTEGFAGVLVTGSPFTRCIEARQERMKGFTRSVAKKVLDLAEESGRLPAGASQRVKVLVTCKPVVFADEEKQARVFETELRNKVLDPQEWIKKRGRDPKVVAANIAAWQAKFPPQPPPGPGGADRPFGKDTTPAPPGSAGGDGSSPNDTSN
jgi:hypothetical protein